MPSPDLPTPSLDHMTAEIERDPREAVTALRETLKRNPLYSDAYRWLARAIEALPEPEQTNATDMHLAHAGMALDSGNLETAEMILRPYLRQKPTDTAAIRMIAQLAMRLDYEPEEEELLNLALELDPNFHLAMLDLANALKRQKRHHEGALLLDRVAGLRPDDKQTMYLRAAELTRAGRFEEGAEQFRQLVEAEPHKVENLVGYAHVLKTLGRRDEAIALLHRSVAEAPKAGVVWWSLSELKTYRFSDDEIAQMEEALADSSLPSTDRFHIHFALGRAFEDRSDAEKAFHHYAEGNRLRRAEMSSERADLETYVSDAGRLFTSDFFASRAGGGRKEPDPIFILGMTRAGSTLVEQILSSHPMVEGTMELPDIPYLASKLYGSMAEYAKTLASLSPAALAEIGSNYLRRVATYRKTDRPFFIDKMPNNWMHVPLIQLALPNAKIVDARRHPLACCFSNYKQHFAAGQSFSYDLEEMGRFYRSYVLFMAQIDRALPGRVHRVLHERMVEDSEREIRELLDFLKLPFDEACLRFHETKRPVRTASAEQVRRPIDRSSTDQWRPFEPWLDPLKEALGSVLDHYPAAPPPDAAPAESAEG